MSLDSIRKLLINGWYIDEIANNEVHKYYYHCSDWYNNELLDEFDENTCRIITKCESLEIF
jgi:hypothetical protein